MVNNFRVCFLLNVTFCRSDLSLGVYEGTATKLAADYRVELAKHIDDEFDQTSFISRCKDGSEGVFTRQPTLTLKHLLLLIMSSRSSIQRGLDEFYQKVNSEDYSIREVTKGAFSMARNKVNEWGFQRLNEVCVDFFYQRAPYHKWHDFRLLAVDGSWLQLPNHPTIKEEFVQVRTERNADRSYSMATCSLLYDVLNQISLDAQLGPYQNSSKKKAGEKALLEGHLPSMKPGDLVLFDRGYPSKLLFFKLFAKGVDFCMCMKGSWWKEVRAFRESDQQEILVEFELDNKALLKLENYPQPIALKQTCRLIKVVLDTGEVEILCTSLTDIKKYPIQEFGELYHKRWHEEEAYKLLKNRVEVERFSGKTAKAVKQDFFAKVFLMSLTAAYAHPIEEKVKAEYKADESRKHDQKINRTNALAMTRNILVGMFDKSDYRQALKAFDNIVFKTREIIRPSRKNKRKHRPKKSYYMNHKPL